MDTLFSDSFFLTILFWIIQGSLVVIGGFIVYLFKTVSAQVKNNTDRIQKLEIKVEKETAVSTEILRRIEASLENMAKKFDEYDENIKKFYQDYDLKKK